MENIPKEWLSVSLGEICFFLDNRRIPLNSTQRQKRQGNFPYYGATGIIDYIDDYIFDEEVLLLGEDGAPFFDKTKDVAFLVTGKSWVNNHAHVLKAADNITSNKFLYYYLNYFDYTNFVGGATRLKLTKTSLDSIPVLLPPLNEQIMIQVKLDEIYSHIRIMRERIKQIKLVKQSILNSFLYDIESKLHPTQSLLPYLIERKEKIGNNWQGFRLIGVDAVKGIIDLRSSTKKGYANYKIVEHGDFVYNPMRVNIGSIAIYRGFNQVLTSPDYIVFKVIDKFSSSLLLDFLKSSLGLSEIANLTQGSVRSRLYFKALVQVKMPMDPQYDKKNIDSSYEVIEKVEEKLPMIENFLDNLKSSILHKAFSGELVKYNYDDTEKEILLKAIKNKFEESLVKSKQVVESKKIFKMNSYKNMLEALKANGGKLTPKELWEVSNYKDDIDAFYSALKKEIEVNHTIIESPDKEYLIAK